MLLFFKARRVKASSLALSSTSRITLLSISYLLKVREREVEGRSPINRAFSPDAASVPIDDALNSRQANACALEFICGVQALERAEQLVGKRHLEASAIVADEKDCLTVSLLTREIDLCAFSLRGELPGVAQQITEHDFQQTLIALGHESFFNLGGHSSPRISLLQFSDHFLSQRAEIDCLAAHLAAGHTRKLQHVVNQLRHLLAGIADLLQIVLPVLIKFVRVVFKERLAEAVDVAQGRA